MQLVYSLRQLFPSTSRLVPFTFDLGDGLEAGTTRTRLLRSKAFEKRSGGLASRHVGNKTDPSCVFESKGPTPLDMGGVPDQR